MTLTYKQKFNKKYGFNKDESHTLAEVSKITGYKLNGLKTIYSKGQDEYYTNPTCVRKHITSSQEWAMARIYSSVMGDTASKVDAKHLIPKISVEYF